MLDDTTPLLTTPKKPQNNLSIRNEDDEGEFNTEYGSTSFPYPPYIQPGLFTSLEKLMFFMLILLLIVLFILIGLFAGGLRIGGDGPSTISPHPRFPQNGTGHQVLKVDLNY
jgi:hypothetical protein